MAGMVRSPCDMLLLRLVLVLVLVPVLVLVLVLLQKSEADDTDGGDGGGGSAVQCAWECLGWRGKGGAFVNTAGTSDGASVFLIVFFPLIRISCLSWRVLTLCLAVGWGTAACKSSSGSCRQKIRGGPGGRGHSRQLPEAVWLLL